jgi:uncharacterized protein
MKIDVRQISMEDSALEEDLDASQYDLETDMVKFSGPIRVKAVVSKITNAVTADLSLNASMYMNCCRCLNELVIDLEKKLRLSYPLDNSEAIIDLGPDIREAIIFDYPIKPLCSPGCKGLCLKCGKNLNEGKCSCSH